jgi:rSAM/selenodomain-associated transferase 2/rSAM/selenodomain-associated transferase 1
MNQSAGIKTPLAVNPNGGCGRLILFTRYPCPGKSKTRLIPALGVEGAANLQRRMTERTLAWARLAPWSDLELCFAGDETLMRAWLGGHAGFMRPQGEGDLGRRMDHCLTRALSEGAGAAVLFGCDIPGNTSQNLANALDRLKHADLVLGPAKDGGYYLIGLKRPAPELFRDMTWGHDQVLKQTLGRADRLGLSYALVDELKDVDYAADLPAWWDAPLPPGSISVVIPALNEARNLAAAVGSLSGPLAPEIILVDGGSKDATREVAKGLGLKQLSAPPSRGGQLRLGCEAAKGDYVLMLHADTRLKPGWHHQVRRILNMPGVTLGAFEFQVDASGPGYWLIRQMVALRSRLARMPYGDQALFIKRGTLEQIGGVPDLPLMEDVELVRRTRSLGRVAVSPTQAVSSSRRWRNKGLARNTLHNWRCFLAYQMGASPKELAQRYYNR